MTNQSLPQDARDDVRLLADWHRLDADAQREIWARIEAALLRLTIDGAPMSQAELSEFIKAHRFWPDLDAEELWQKLALLTDAELDAITILLAVANLQWEIDNAAHPAVSMN